MDYRKVSLPTHLPTKLHCYHGPTVQCLNPWFSPWAPLSSSELQPGTDSLAKPSIVLLRSALPSSSQVQSSSAKRRSTNSAFYSLKRNLVHLSESKLCAPNQGGNSISAGPFKYNYAELSPTHAHIKHYVSVQLHQGPHQEIKFIELIFPLTSITWQEQ